MQDRINSLENELVKRDPAATPVPSRDRSTPYTRSPLDRQRSRASSRSRSPPHWDFNQSLQQSTRIPTPPSYRYHEDSARANLAQINGAGPSRAEASSLGGQGTYSKTTGSGAQGQEGVDGEHSHGTLVIDRAGRSRYFGATAGTEWLKNVSLPYFLMERGPTDHRSKRLMVRVNHRGFCQLPARHILVYERWISSPLPRPISQWSKLSTNCLLSMRLGRSSTRTIDTTRGSE
jgi:hypothetical protein